MSRGRRRGCGGCSGGIREGGMGILNGRGGGPGISKRGRGGGPDDRTQISLSHGWQKAAVLLEREAGREPSSEGAPTLPCGRLHPDLLPSRP